MREMSPSASKVRSVPESTREEISGMSRNSSLNLTTSLSAMTSNTSSDHLLPKRDTTFLMGQVSMSIFVIIVIRMGFMGGDGSCLFTLYNTKLLTKPHH